MVGQDALARASSTPRTDPGTLRASARTAPWRMLTEADSTCGYGIRKPTRFKNLWPTDDHGAKTGFRVRRSSSDAHYVFARG